jgi:hypothetical protein
MDRKVSPSRAQVTVSGTERRDLREEIVSLDPDDFEHKKSLAQSALDKEYQMRRDQGRDMKLIIAARDGATGVGKTTLGVQMAKNWDVNGWTWRRATFDPVEYMVMYDDNELVPSGSVMLLDEVEQAADNRRSMSGENVELSQDWATKRYREVSTIATLPDTGMLDDRLMRLADFIIIVIERGFAACYRSKIRDGSGEKFRQLEDLLEWGAIDDDPDYQKVSKMKAEHLEGNTEARWIQRSEHKKELEEEVEEKTHEVRRDIIGSVYHNTDLTQKEISSMLPDRWEVTQSQVSRLCKKYREEHDVE